MVLLCSENNINIKKNHMLKCLEKKKQSFEVFTLAKPLKEEHLLEECNTINIVDLTDKDVKVLFETK